MCLTAQTLFSVQPISQVLEVQMSSGFFVENIRPLPTTCMRLCAQILMLAMLF
jgi:hypothetical protein